MPIDIHMSTAGGSKSVTFTASTVLSLPWTKYDFIPVSRPSKVAACTVSGTSPRASQASRKAIATFEFSSDSRCSARGMNSIDLYALHRWKKDEAVAADD